MLDWLKKSIKDGTDQIITAFEESKKRKEQEKKEQQERAIEELKAKGFRNGTCKVCGANNLVYGGVCYSCQRRAACMRR